MKGEERQGGDGEACVTVVTGTLHRNDFNRSSDTHTQTDSYTKREADKRQAQCRTDGQT